MSELTTNGGFDQDSDWTKDTNWTIAGGVATALVATNVQFLRQPVSGIKNGVYTITFTVVTVGAGNARFSFVGSAQTGTTRSAPGTFTETVTLTSNVTQLRIGRATTDFSGDIDNVSMQGITGVTDEVGLGNAITNSISSNAPSPEQRVRAGIQYYLNNGSGSTVAITINEVALAAAVSSALAPWPSRSRRARAAIEAYTLTLAAQ